MDQEDWQGIRAETREHLQTRDYDAPSLSEQLAGTGVMGARLIERTGLEAVWIPGVEIFGRQVFQQKARGYFGEFARENEGPLGKIGMWPKQWATASMFAGTAKGFHLHPPHLPDGEDPEKWFKKLYLDEPENYSLRPYGKEQWDVMFFIRGTIEMILIDERVGLERKKMRFTIEGDNRPGDSNIAVVIPPGVAHALRSLSGEDSIMVYGTSTIFAPEREGRIASSIEESQLPTDWSNYADTTT